MKGTPNKLTATCANEPTAKGIAKGWETHGVEDVKITPDGDTFVVTGVTFEKPESPLWKPDAPKLLMP